MAKILLPRLRSMISVLFLLASTAGLPAAALAQNATSVPGAAPTTAPTGVPEATPEDRILGKAEAPITIVEYASLTCPHCAAFESETLPKLKQEWIDAGKARLIFRDFPFDQPGLHAAMLARCAPADRFFGFLEVLFSSQRTWALARDPDAALERIGKLGGVSEDQFKSCMKDENAANRIVAGRLQGEKEYGVDSTPTFFINGRKLVGNQPYDDFVKALNAAAAKS